MIDPDAAGTYVGWGVAALIALGKFLRDHFEKSPTVERARRIDEARDDISKVLADRDIAHAAELEKYEVRELNLTAQIAENSRLHLMAIQQLTADRDADRIELHRLREAQATFREDIEEQRRMHESCELRLLQMQQSIEMQERSHREIVTALNRQIEMKDRRGYSTAKKVKTDDDGFTATDVWPDGKPRP